MNRFAVYVFWMAFLASSRNVAQSSDSLTSKTKSEDKLRLTVYGRFIANRSGLLRTDQNVVANVRLYKWLRADLGLRCGEKLNPYASYYAYKFELQTKYFWNTLRFFARITNNIVDYAKPPYRRTNKLFVFENRIPLGKRFQGTLAAGYNYPAIQFNSLDAKPLFNRSSIAAYPIFRMAVKYFLRDKKGFLEFMYGSYDVFNAYEIGHPFVQASIDKELGDNANFFVYYRYQMDGNLGHYVNNFLGYGLIFHFRDKS